MSRFSGSSGQLPLPVPAEISTAVDRSANIALVYDLDHLSHAGPRGARVDNDELATLAVLVEETASACGRLLYVRAVCSTRTASVHRLLLSATANNIWQAVAGSHGADAHVVAELNHLARTRRMQLVVLVAGDGLYAGPVANLRASGSCVWVLHRPSSLSWRLYRGASAATALPAAPGRSEELVEMVS